MTCVKIMMNVLKNKEKKKVKSIHIYIEQIILGLGETQSCNSMKESEKHRIYQKWLIFYSPSTVASAFNHPRSEVSDRCHDTPP